MKRAKKSGRERGRNQIMAPEAGATAREYVNQAAGLKPETAFEPRKLFAFKRLEQLFRGRLAKPLVNLIPQVTGLRLHVVWHHPLDTLESGVVRVLCPRARQWARAMQRRPECCEPCLKGQWKAALCSARHCRYFMGQCGVTNFLAHPHVGEVRTLTLVLQAKVLPRASFPKGTGPAGSIPSRPINAEEAVSRGTFQHAVALARLVVHDLEATAQAGMAGIRLDNALRRLDRSQTEAVILQRKLQHGWTAITEPAARAGTEDHAQNLVKVMCDYVQQHCHRPITLKDVASAMEFNACYLSALFSQTTGVRFHRFLGEIRLSRARHLLRDPCNRVSEVAVAVGYASTDAFRHAFKANHGLSPESWRTRQ